MFVLITVVIYLSLSYTSALFIASRRRRALPMPAPDGLLFVFVVPCLNEERVIGGSLERLLAMEGNFIVLVIDDGSQDATADVVRAFGDDRVYLLRRELPNARQGKGRALNNAYRFLLRSEILAGRRPDDVVIVVVDADGRLASNALSEVAPYFRDPKVGAVQIGVRMYNATSKLVARMQDLEFISYTEIFQRARQRLGSVGLGGNGQFTRLAALQSLGDEPWSDCLTEDLDLGLRLLVNGWNNSFCPTTRVNQQALTRIRPLVRQRTRWFQGHLQTWKRIPMILRSDLPVGTIADLVNLIINPGLVLATSLLIPLMLATLTAVIVASPAGFAHAMLSNSGINMFFWYLLTFGLAPFYAFAYWMQEKSISFPRALIYAHAYTIYGYMWFAAGWRAVGRIVLRRSSWAKTARLLDTQGGGDGVVVPAAATHVSPTGAGPRVIDLTKPDGAPGPGSAEPAAFAATEPAAAAAFAAAEPAAAAYVVGDAHIEEPLPMDSEPDSLRRHRLLFGAGVPIVAALLALSGTLVAVHGAGAVPSGPTTASNVGPPRPAPAVSLAEILPGQPATASSATGGSAAGGSAPAVSAPPGSTGPRTGAPAAAPVLSPTLSSGTTPGSAGQAPKSTPAPAPGPGPVPPPPGAPSGNPPAAPSHPTCPSGHLSWSAQTTRSQQGRSDHWYVALNGSVANQATASVQIDSMVADVSYHRPDGTAASTEITLTPASAVVAPSGITTFDGSTTLDSSDAPDIGGLTIHSHWSDPAYGSCPAPT